MARRLVPLLVIASFALLVFAFAGCGGDDNGASGDTTTTETTTTEETTTDTETTETETETTEDEDTDTTETSALGDDFASSENCQQFAQIGAQISESLTGTSDVADIEEAFSQYAASAPDEIKDDFQTLADFFGEVADAVGNLQAGDTPSAEDLAALQSLDSAAATEASTNIGTWVQENCS